MVAEWSSQVIAQGNEPMFTDLPVAMQLFAHRGQEGVASRSGQPLWVDHQSGDGGLVGFTQERDIGRRQSFIAIDTLLLEPQFQQCSDQQGIEVNRDALLGMTEQVQAVQRAFQEPEDQLNGIITNDKFCMSRTAELQLSWWRRPLRLR